MLHREAVAVLVLSGLLRQAASQRVASGLLYLFASWIFFGSQASLAAAADSAKLGARGQYALLWNALAIAVLTAYVGLGLVAPSAPSQEVAAAEGRQWPPDRMTCAVACDELDADVEREPQPQLLCETPLAQRRP